MCIIYHTYTIPHIKESEVTNERLYCGCLLTSLTLCFPQKKTRKKTALDSRKQPQDRTRTMKNKSSIAVATQEYCSSTMKVWSS
jgi:hypothetical protein